MVQYDDGKSEQVLDPAYQLGTPYHVRIIAADSTVDVLYNGEKKAELPLTGSGWYWKVGAYVQANSDTGDAQSTGAVTVYALQVNHSDTAAGPYRRRGDEQRRRANVELPRGGQGRVEQDGRRAGRCRSLRARQPPPSPPPTSSSDLLRLLTHPPAGRAPLGHSAHPSL